VGTKVKLFPKDTTNLTYEERKKILDDIKSRVLNVYRFNRTILVVALKTLRPGWAAYIGVATDVEDSPVWMIASGEGSKVEQRVAEALFPELKDQYEYESL
jgi:hypothetical protein